MSNSPLNSPWWQPERHKDRRGPLLFRNTAKAAIRRYFADEGFIEVDVGALQVSPGNETHLHAFQTQLIGTDQRQHSLYLHTSPEFSCKKLLAAGETKIFTFAPCFRNQERGALHHPEFSMLEWYRANETIDTVMTDCTNLVQLISLSANTSQWRMKDIACDATATPLRLTVRSVFQKYLGFDLGESLKQPETPDQNVLAHQARTAGVRVSADDTWSDIFSRCLTEIEDKIWRDRDYINDAGEPIPPIFLEGYPSPEAPLALPDDTDPRFAKRFEMFACGVELANGYGELCDGPLLRRRLEAEMTEKQRIYGERYPLDEDFLKACAIMPPSSGCALGFDRLVMLATQCERIEQVLWAPLRDANDTSPTQETDDQ
ncbi:MAG: EF-P lysine aminoacylase EpmA [Hyphomicrobiaceae bacterium]